MIHKNPLGNSERLLLLCVCFCCLQLWSNWTSIGIICLWFDLQFYDSIRLVWLWLGGKIFACSHPTNHTFHANPRRFYWNFFLRFFTMFQNLLCESNQFWLHFWCMKVLPVPTGTFETTNSLIQALLSLPNDKNSSWSKGDKNMYLKKRRKKLDWPTLTFT